MAKYAQLTQKGLLYPLGCPMTASSGAPNLEAEAACPPSLTFISGRTTHSQASIVPAKAK